MGVAWPRPRAGRRPVAPLSRIGPALAAILGALTFASCAHTPIDSGLKRLAHHPAAKHRVAAADRPTARPAVARPADGVAKPVSADDIVASLPAATKAAKPVPIPLPDKSLMERQGPPDCELKTEPAAPSEAEAKIKMLDHERRCYREVETIVRGRLDRLQDAVGATVTAIEAREKVQAPAR